VLAVAARNLLRGPALFSASCTSDDLPRRPMTYWAKALGG